MSYHFTIPEVLWTLTFAALLVLMVVLLGRDRVRRFPWFTSSIVLVALHMLVNRLLYGKMAPLASSEMTLVLADIGVVISLLVAVEMARRAFTRATRTMWIAGTVVLLAIGGIVLARWGAWPAWQTLTASSTLAHLRLMQLAAQKGDLLTAVLFIEMAVLLAIAGRRLGAGWRTHAQQIVLGLATASVVQLAVRGIWQRVINAAPPRSQADVDRLTSLQAKLLNINSLVYLVVILAWIVCLWIDEPGSNSASAPGETIADVEALPAASKTEQRS